MFEFFSKKNKTVEEEQPPIPLPELIQSKNNPVAIESILKDGNALWGWYKADQLSNGQLNLTAMINISYGFDGLALFRKEGDFLVKYRTEIIQKKIFLRISEISLFTHSNIMELYNTELSDSYKILYDEEQVVAANCQAYIHDLTKKTINDYLTNHRVMTVGEEHFYSKKDYPNGLPEEFKGNKIWNI